MPERTVIVGLGWNSSSVLDATNMPVAGFQMSTGAAPMEALPGAISTTSQRGFAGSAAAKSTTRALGSSHHRYCESECTVAASTMSARPAVTVTVIVPAAIEQ